MDATAVVVRCSELLQQKYVNLNSRCGVLRQINCSYTNIVKLEVPINFH